MKNKQSKVLMVQPVSFGYNKETAGTNLFQTNDTLLTPKQVQAHALKEFNAFVEKLKKKGVETIVMKDTKSPRTPDSVFPNNILSFHSMKEFYAPTPPEMNVPGDKFLINDAKIVVFYPMLAPNRRAEKSLAYRKKLKQYNVVMDLSYNAEQDIFLEGTGSIVFDYINKIAYASHSKRTFIPLFEALCKQLDFDTISFHAVDQNGKEIYHTNVLMCIGDRFAVVCEESIRDKEELYTVMKSLIDSDHEIITISYEQLNKFAGNMYQLFNDKGESLIVMSSQAYKSLKKEQLKKLKKFGKIVHTPLETIEKYGGGSARCMIADIRY